MVYWLICAVMLDFDFDFDTIKAVSLYFMK